MADQPHDDTNDQGVDIKELRARADQAAALEREVAALKRDKAFRQAGIDPDDKRASYFIKGYEGELDPQAIRAEAREAGFLPEPGPTPEQQQQLEGQGRIGQVVSQSAPEPSQDKIAELEKAFAEGGQIGLIAAAAALGVPLASDN